MIRTCAGAIENLFLTREVSPRGKYSVRLFDAEPYPNSTPTPTPTPDLNPNPNPNQVRLFDDRIGTWRVVSVDDCFPCDDDGAPHAAPHAAQPLHYSTW
jgi:hypothetical protein